MGGEGWDLGILTCNRKLASNAKLAVAIRGDVLYDRLITGSCIADTDSEDSLKKSISTTKKGNSIDDNLIRYFVKPPA